MKPPDFQSKNVDALLKRLNENQPFIQVITGPRQVGKTTAMLQAIWRGQTVNFSGSDGLRPEHASSGGRHRTGRFLQQKS